MLLAGSTRSPSIPNGVLAWFEGDIFKLNLKGKLFDQDKTPVKFMEGATLTLRVLNERREIVKEFECSPDEHGNIEINIDEETTALFPWGKYKGQMLYDDGDKRVTVGVYEIIVGDVDNHRNNKYAVKADFEAWVSRGVKEVAIDENRHLIFTMTDGNVLDLGEANDGGYYQPFVSENGDLNWTPSAPGMIEIPTVNIKGPVGQNGSDGKDGESVSIERVTTSTDPGGVNEVFFSDGSKLQVRNGLNGSGGGGTGDDGGYYTPSISDDGTLTWSASKTGMPMVSPANIKGPAGRDGSPGKDGIDGIDGRDGIDGSPGKDGIDGASVYVTSVEQSEAAGGESVVNFSDGSSVSVFNGVDGEKGKDGTDASVTAANITAALGFTPANPADFPDEVKTALTTGPEWTDAEQVAALAKLGGIKIDLLWINSSPTSAFNAQTIPLDLSDYTWVWIVARLTTSTGYQTSAFGYVGGLITVKDQSTSTSGSTATFYSNSRVVRTNSESRDSITFDVCKRVNVTAKTVSDVTDYIIPIRILGIKNVENGT